MGWKYTKNIERQKALDLIYRHLEDLDNEGLGIVMSSMFGENTKLPYYGANFSVYNKGDMRFDEYGNLKDECK